VSYSYDLPKLAVGNALLRNVVNDWALSGVTTLQSGLPFSVTDSTAGTIYGISTYAQFAPGLGPADAMLSGDTQSRLSRYFNTAAFTSAPVIGNGTGFGNAGRDILRGPGQLNFDAGIGRSFNLSAIREGSELQFRSEFFNFANHPQFNNPGSNRGAPTTFGIISSTAVSPRIVQFALKYVF
jgi:hypothetical protein